MAEPRVAIQTGKVLTTERRVDASVVGRIGVSMPGPLAVDQPGLTRTSRLMLRPLRETDRAEFLRLLAEDAGAGRVHLEQCAGFAKPGETDEQVFERHLAMTRDGDRTGLACRRVGVTDDGRIVGGFNLATISRGLVMEADATWWVSKRCCGAGFGVEGVQAMLDVAFADLPMGLGLHRVNAAIRRDNEASRRTARRLGFIHEPGESLSIQHGAEWVAHDLWIKSVV